GPPPDTPAVIARQVAATSLPTGVIEPIPVTTTLLFIRSSSLRRFAPSLGIPQFGSFVVPRSGASHLRSEFRSSGHSWFLAPALRTFARSSAVRVIRSSSLRRFAPSLGIPRY